MGFFDDKKFLTGENGLVQTGDTFVIHDVKIAGEVRNLNANAGTGDEPARVPEAALLVSKTGQEPPLWAYTTGRGIVNQVQRIEPDDRASLPWHVILADRELGGNRKVHVIQRVPDQTPGPVEDTTAPAAE